MKNIAILIADGFEDTELIGAIDFWTREGIEFQLISIQDKEETKGSYYAKVDTKPLNQVNLNEFSNLFIPGGKSYSIFEEFEKTSEIILDFYNQGKGVFAICAAPSLLYKAGILEGKKFTVWPGLDIEESTNNEYEVDDNVITGRDYLATMTFAKAVSKYIKK